MQFYNLLIKHRFWLSLLSVAIGIVLQVTKVSSFWPVFPLYLIALIGLFSHFFIGPLRLIQAPMEAGNTAEVEKILNSVWFPNLLYKPVRSTFYSIKGQMAMMKQDLNTAEKYLRKSNDLGSPMPEAEGANKLQLGMMAMQKGDHKQARALIEASLRLGIPDTESKAVAYLTLAQIMINKRDINSVRAGKAFYRKAKDCKPKNKEVLDQMKEMDKYVSRIPG
jgi:hypothetical protein